MWAVSANNGAIEQFAPAAAGDTAPGRVVSGPGTGPVTPSGIALDSAARAYVTDEAAQTIAVFLAGASDNVVPVAYPMSASVCNSFGHRERAGDAGQSPHGPRAGRLDQRAGGRRAVNFFGFSVLRFALAGPFNDVAPKAVGGGSTVRSACRKPSTATPAAMSTWPTRTSG